MRKWYSVGWPLVRVLGFSAVLAVVGMLILHACSSYGTRHPVPIVQVDMNSISHALQLYEADYGQYPEGPHERIISALCGENPRGTEFLRFTENSTNPLVFLDPWHTPYDIITTNRTNLIVRSAGKNRAFYDQDDIIHEERIPRRGFP